MRRFQCNNPIVVKQALIKCGIDNYMHILGICADLIKLKRSVYKDHDPAILDFLPDVYYTRCQEAKDYF